MDKKSPYSISKLVIFTLVVVIITGLSLYKMQALTRKAERAALTSYASSLTAMNSENTILRKSGNKKFGHKINNCSDIEKLLPGGLPKGYSIENKQVSEGKSVSCGLKTRHMKALFTATGV